MNPVRFYSQDNSMIGRPGGAIFVNATGRTLQVYDREGYGPLEWPSHDIPDRAGEFRGVLRALDSVLRMQLRKHSYWIVIANNRWSDTLGLAFAFDHIRQQDDVGSRLAPYRLRLAS